MARTYSVTGDQNVANATETALTLQSTTAIRPNVYFIAVSPLGDAIDFMVRWVMERFTVDDGTGDSPDVSALNDLDPASVMVAQDNHTTEPNTYSGEIPLEIAMNTRAPQQWHAHDRSDRIVLAAVATEGLGFQPVSTATTSAVIVNAHFEE